MFMMQIDPPLSHGFNTLNWLFLRLFNAAFSFNIRLLWVFRRGGLTESNSSSTRVKKLIKV